MLRSSAARVNRTPLNGGNVGPLRYDSGPGMTASNETIAEPEHAVGGARSLAAAVSPLGGVRLEPSSPEDAAPVPAAVADRIARAFETSAGHGLLHLGLAEVETALPPSLGYFRDLARRFVTRLCRVPDLEEQRERVAGLHDGEDLEGFARAAPPMTGAEYVSTEMLERVWGEIEFAFRAVVASHEGTVQSYLEARNPVWNLIGRVYFHLA